MREDELRILLSDEYKGWTYTWKVKCLQGIWVQCAKSPFLNNVCVRVLQEFRRFVENPTPIFFVSYRIAHIAKR